MILIFSAKLQQYSIVNVADICIMLIDFFCTIISNFGLS